MFVEQTRGEELASRLREMFLRVEPMVGFYIKVVERTGKSLQSMFPLTNLWEGVSCGREGECTTCYQGAEALPDCTRQSILYENICTSCVPGATGRRPVEDIPGDKAVLYVGETSRSILERSREHWDGYKKQKQDNHIWKHQMMEHNGEQANFTMRVVGSHRSALSRQVGEAVRIRRRGGEGNILNSRAEYNRSHIPRLQVEDKEEVEKRKEQMRKRREEIDQELSLEQNNWEQEKSREMAKERKEAVKNLGSNNTTKGRRSKRQVEIGNQDIRLKGSKRQRKYSLLSEDWGAPGSIAEEPGEGAKHKEGEHQIPPTPSREPEGGGSTSPITEVKEALGETKVLVQGKITLFLSEKLEQGTPRAELHMGIGSSDQGGEPGAIGSSPNHQLPGGDHSRDERGAAYGPGDDQEEPLSPCIKSGGGFESLETAPSVGQTLKDDNVEDDICRLEDAKLKDDLGMMSNKMMSNDPQVMSSGVNSNGGGGANVIPDVEMSNVVQECQFVRGICVEHKIKGEKLKIKHKAWVKKKFGYGWLTTTKVKYSCNLMGNNSSTLGLHTNDDLSQSPGRIIPKSNTELGCDNLDRIEHVQSDLGIIEQDYGKQISSKK